MKTMDMQLHEVGKWDLVIAHPPCTFLTSCGSRWLFDKHHNVINQSRLEKGFEAKDFFMRIVREARTMRLCIENPAPIKIFDMPPYTQIVEPYMFGEHWKKRTCLWLWNLPQLKATNIVEPFGCWTVSSGGKTCRVKLKKILSPTKSAKERSRTFEGIAEAMAEQWGNYIMESEEDNEKDTDTI